MDKIKIGFSTGCLFKTHKIKDTLKIFRELKVRVVELSFLKLGSDQQKWLTEISKEDLKGFDYVSLHAPNYNYGHNDGTFSIFKKIETINNFRPLDLVVFHPDNVIDFSVFKEANFKIAFENMDKRKKSHKISDEFKPIFKNNDYGLVLDVNHIYSNDKTMDIIDDFYKKFGNRINEIHLSGYSNNHIPLCESKQLEIIKSIRDFNTPIIVESVIAEGKLKEELSYIKNAILKINNK